MNCLIFRLTVQNYYSKLLKVVSVKKKMQKKCTFSKKVHFLGEKCRIFGSFLFGLLRHIGLITSVFLAQGHDYASLFLRSSFGLPSEWYRSGNGVCPLSLRYPSVRVRDKLYCQLSEIHVGILFLFAIHLVCSLCFVFEHLYERGGFYDSDIRSVCA